MLLGAAILGAVASKKYSTLQEAMKALNAAGQVGKDHFIHIYDFASASIDTNYLFMDMPK